MDCLLALNRHLVALPTSAHKDGGDHKKNHELEEKQEPGARLTCSSSGSATPVASIPSSSPSKTRRIQPRSQCGGRGDHEGVLRSLILGADSPLVSQIMYLSCLLTTAS
jgi:hypothetical protein